MSANHLGLGRELLPLMLRDGVISDELWDVLEPVMPQDAGRPGRPWNDHRMTLEGIIWRFRTGSPWRDLPEAFGPYQSVWQRHRLWSTDGTYERMFAAVREQAGARSAMRWRRSCRSTPPSCGRTSTPLAPGGTRSPADTAGHRGQDRITGNLGSCPGSRLTTRWAVPAAG